MERRKNKSIEGVEEKNAKKKENGRWRGWREGRRECWTRAKGRMA